MQYNDIFFMVLFEYLLHAAFLILTISVVSVISLQNVQLLELWIAVNSSIN